MACYNQADGCDSWENITLTAELTNPHLGWATAHARSHVRTTCRITAGTVPTGLRKEPSGFPGLKHWSCWVEIGDWRGSQWPRESSSFTMEMSAPPGCRTVVLMIGNGFVITAVTVPMYQNVSSLMNGPFSGCLDKLSSTSFLICLCHCPQWATIYSHAYSTTIGSLWQLPPLSLFWADLWTSHAWSDHSIVSSRVVIQFVCLNPKNNERISSLFGACSISTWIHYIQF